jgi:hypothetical protein
LAVSLAGHVDVHAGVERQPCPVGRASCDAVLAQLPNGVEVTDDEAAKPPLIAQHAGQQDGVAVQRRPGQFVERGHDPVDASRHRRLERRQVHFPHSAFRYVGDVVVAPAFGRAVGRQHK